MPDMITCTRKIGFDSAHRVMRHETKCKNLHGHRYTAEIEAYAIELDTLGRVIDFSVLKSIIGGWIDEHWDHGTILNREDFQIIELCRLNNWKVFTLDCNPTAENMAAYLLTLGNELLKDFDIRIASVKLWETPNCYALARTLLD